MCVWERGRLNVSVNRVERLTGDRTGRPLYCTYTLSHHCRCISGHWVIFDWFGFGQKNLLIIKHKQISWILASQTGGPPYSDTSPCEVCEELMLGEKKKTDSEGNFVFVWWERWSSCYVWRLMFERLWVWFLVPYTGWTFFTLICRKNCIVCVWKDQK